MKSTAPKKPKLVIAKYIPYELERHITEVLDPDTNGGQEDSPAGQLVRDWNAAVPLTQAHLPILLREARQLLAIIEDADEWQDFPEQARDRRELHAFIRRFAK